MVRVTHDDEAHVIAFVRAHEGDVVFAAFNFSPEQRRVRLGEGPHAGGYADAFTGEPVTLDIGSDLTLPGWGYRVLVGA